MVPGERDGVGNSYGVWDGHVHTAGIKIENQQGFTVYHITSFQCYMAAWMGGEFGENGYLYMYG